MGIKLRYPNTALCFIYSCNFCTNIDGTTNK
jgi:hypothetical protein